MKTISIFLLTIVFLSFAALAQNDIQSFQAKVNEVKSKPARELTSEDVKFLESVISMSSEKFGKLYQKIVDEQKSIAKSKLKEYDLWLKEKNRSDSLDLELGTEKLKAEAQGEVIKQQSDTIASQKALIEQLRNDITQLKNQINRATRTNKKLKDEKIRLQTVISENNEIVVRVGALLSENIELRKNVPDDVRAELEDTECKVAELLAENYLLTLEKLKRDKEYLDGLREFFKDNKQYPDEFYKYLNEGRTLMMKLRESEVPCVYEKADEVKASIDELRTIIQNKDCDFFCQIAGFFSENIWLLGLLVLVIIGLVLIFIVRK
jgi:hypothetical protein